MDSHQRLRQDDQGREGRQKALAVGRHLLCHAAVRGFQPLLKCMDGCCAIAVGGHGRPPLGRAGKQGEGQEVIAGARGRPRGVPMSRS